MAFRLTAQLTEEEQARVFSKDPKVRRAAVREGIGWDFLKFDPNPMVALEVAKKGYALELLMTHESGLVRAEVARQGYGLDKLEEDSDQRVRNAVQATLAKKGMTISEWVGEQARIAGRPDPRVKPAPKWAAALKPDYPGNTYNVEKQQLIFYDEQRQGYYVRTVTAETLNRELLEKSGLVALPPADTMQMLETADGGERVVEEPRPIAEVYKSKSSLNYYLTDEKHIDNWIPATLGSLSAYVGETPAVAALVNSRDEMTRQRAARAGLAPEKLVNDRSRRVRAAVASTGYKSTALKDDKDEWVRIGVAKSGKHHDELMYDGSWRVRAAVARSVNEDEAYILRELRKDDVPTVRAAVAEKGYGLEALSRDEDPDVRVAVAEQGFGLDKFVNDDDLYVQFAARRSLIGEDFTGQEIAPKELDERVRAWAMANPKKCVTPEAKKLSRKPSRYVRREDGSWEYTGPKKRFSAAR